MNNSFIIPAIMTLTLSELEATIVLEVLHCNEVTVSSLSKKLGLSRTTLYKHIDTLIRKNILEKAKKGATYSIKNKEELKNHISNNLIQAEEETIALLQKNTHEIPEIHVLKGHNNLKTVYENIGIDLKKGDVYYRYSSRKEDHKKSELYSELKKRKDLYHPQLTS